MAEAGIFCGEDAADDSADAERGKFPRPLPQHGNFRTSTRYVLIMYYVITNDVLRVLCTVYVLSTV